MKDANPRIVILTADTGGGHRSASEALAEALHELGQDNIEIVDVFRYVPWPLSHVPKWYLPTIHYAARLWGALYNFLEGRQRNQIFVKGWLGPWTRRGLKKLCREHQPGLFISTHPLFQHLAADVLHHARPAAPFVTLVTDLASAHRLWFTPLTDLCLVPSEGLRQIAIADGVAPEKIHVTGLPVHRAFSMNRYISRQETRATLQWLDRTTVLLVGGGEGMGDLEAMTESVEAALPDTQLLVVTGRNEKLCEKLLKHQWAGPVRILGFARNMPQLMRAADVIVTKAGPSTLSEALICGLPILISGFVPGQEEGNVKYILENQAGYFLDKPAEELGTVLKDLLGNGGTRLSQMAQRAYALGRPDAARDAARWIMQLYEEKMVRYNIGAMEMSND